MHIRFESRCANKMVQSKTKFKVNKKIKKRKQDSHLELAPLDKFEILVNRSRCLVFHFFCNIFEKASPTRSRAELRNVVRGHLDTFISCHYQATTGQVMDVVKICRGCNGGEVGCRLVENINDTLFCSVKIFIPCFDPKFL